MGTKWLYNSETGAVLGRTCKSWIEIVCFYIVFYIFTAGLFVAFLYGFLAVEYADVPSFYGPGSMNAIPGISVRPNPVWEGSKYTVIHFDASDPKTYMKHVEQLRKELRYYNTSMGPRQIHCSGTEYPKHGQSDHFSSKSEVCFVDITEKEDASDGLGKCGCDQNRNCDKAFFGYDHNEPCIMLRVNRVLGWYPQMFTKEGAKVPEDIVPEYKDLFNWLQDEKKTAVGAAMKSCFYKRIFIKCKGKTEEDREHEMRDTFEYFPSKGIHFCYYPFMGQVHYQTPIIMVKLKNLPPSQAFTILCSMYTKNVIPHSEGRTQIGENEVPIVAEHVGASKPTASP